MCIFICINICMNSRNCIHTYTSTWILLHRQTYFCMSRYKKCMYVSNTHSSTLTLAITRTSPRLSPKVFLNPPRNATSSCASSSLAQPLPAPWSASLHGLSGTHVCVRACAWIDARSLSARKCAYVSFAVCRLCGTAPRSACWCCACGLVAGLPRLLPTQSLLVWLLQRRIMSTAMSTDGQRTLTRAPDDNMRHCSQFRIP